MQALAFTVLVTLGGCGRDATGGPPVPTCDGVGFSMEGEAWEMPPSGAPPELYPWDDLWVQLFQDDCGGRTADLYALTRDVTGDRTPDLVMMADECRDPEVGFTRWLVHRGTGAGFGAAEPWDLPEVPGAEEDWPPYVFVFGAYVPTGDCGTYPLSDLATSLLDMTGDGIDDLIVSMDECGDPDIGQTRWRVHRGTGDGYGDAELWELPPRADLDGPYRNLADERVDTQCGGLYVHWLLDLTGDGILDLVLMADECEDPRVGRDHWTVFPGTGAGFGDAEPWTLPTPELTEDEIVFTSYVGSSTQKSCGFPFEYDFSYRVVDLTGDRTPDMVVTVSECEDSEVGVSQWLVHPGTASGFGPAQVWQLPTTALDADEFPFGRTLNTIDASCGDTRDDFVYTTTDVTADGIADLVVTRDECGDPRVGKGVWRIHRGTGAGFGAAEVWKLPNVAVPGDEYPFGNLEGTSDEANCGEPFIYDFSMETVDLTGDGMVDIVVTRDDCGDIEVGRTRWTVYRGICE